MRAGLILAAALGAACPFAAAAASLVPPLAQKAAAPQMMPALVQRFQLDYGSLDRTYTVANGRARAARMQAFWQQWLLALDALPVATMGVEDRIDLVMLRNHIVAMTQEQALDAAKFSEAQALLPFVRAIIDLAEARRMMQVQDGAASARALQQILVQVEQAQEKLLASGDLQSGQPLASRSVANRAIRIINTAARDLKDWHAYYDGYDPQLSWWVKRPYAELDKALKLYGATLQERLVGKESATRLNVTGDPIGRAALVHALKTAMIPYTPEELMALAEKELAWGEAELRQAASEMGYQDNWHAAMEKVKTLYVPPGEQTAMVRGLAHEAIAYLDQHQLVTIPEVARHSWRMDMLSPEQQLVSPFFLGGETIFVSYPTADMTHEQKLMTMRGNNPHFSRATVHHELIPGHHLQMFMADRHQPHRRLFDSPFYTEGWAVYWEMLLYERKFAVKPEDRIGMMFWRNHRAARILFSLGFHMGKLTPEQAVQMLVKRVGHEPDNARAEVRRSFNGDYPPLYQAGYMVGALQLQALRRELVDGGSMPLRDFHDQVLEGGILPIELVRARLKGDKIGRDFTSGWRFYR